MKIKTTLDEYPINKLVAAVIIRAQAEAARGDRDALAWLESEAPLWADAIGIDLYRTIPRWIDRGCKPSRTRAALEFV